MRSKTKHTDAFWRSFTKSCGGVDGDYVVVAFGDGPAMATELAALAVSGRKRATCSLARDYANAPDT